MFILNFIQKKTQPASKGALMSEANFLINTLILFFLVNRAAIALFPHIFAHCVEHV